jgi:hypothetical protein
MINSNSLNKTLKKSASFILLAEVILVFIMLSNLGIAGSTSFTPPSPSGSTSGDINEEIEFTISTTEGGSFWMFDWGDGSFSEWIEVEESDTYVSQTYSWTSYGTYEVSVKKRSVYGIQSLWSSPLVVTISPPGDLDEDGWDNVLEEAYGTDPENPDDYPLDTDNDGIPDETISEEYIGDADDDGDGLKDTLEMTFGSNSKDETDVDSVIIDSVTYYLIDTNSDGVFNIFLNSEAETHSLVTVEEGKLLLDIDGDGSTDYSYSNGVLTTYGAGFEIPWIIIIPTTIILTLVIIFILYKKGVIYLYEEEYIVEE